MAGCAGCCEEGIVVRLGGTDSEPLALVEHMGSQNSLSGMNKVSKVQALQMSALESLLHSLTKEGKQGFLVSQTNQKEI
ncbi:hypothetical protein NDU88_004486 [Pleurodeles waltl]|uniref:Uncharacterized protein n=1 Tax=Pleurodeles waltl TaxID=8319 RepID=A0AAV7SIX1_PLEWA|nr:hypothetical protein NDU88_004486 [Pleurodeles waltl]